MNQTDWEIGPPREEGLFWFNIDWRAPFKENFLFVLQCKKYQGKLHTHLFGKCGSGPLKYFYIDKMFKQTRHSRIYLPLPHEWKNTFKPVKDYMWYKNLEGYHGLISGATSGWNNNVGGTLIWLDHPSQGSDHGVWLKEKDGLFAPMKIPK